MRKIKLLRRLSVLFLILSFLLTSCTIDGIKNVDGETELLDSAQNTIIESLGTTQESSFEIHFIDVGQADAALVLCDGESMLIDGGNREDSNVIYSVLKNREIFHLDFIVATHAHEDHIGGLSGALNLATVGTVLCPVTEHDSETFRNFVKCVEKEEKSLTVPKVNDTFNLGSAEVKILAVNTLDDTNNTSIVLKIIYGNTTFLFTGDAEREVEGVLLDCGADLSSTVLKVGHHGSETSTSYPFLREVMPKYAVISVGEGNTYGHPTDETLSRLGDAGVKVFRTDLQGDIKCKSDGNEVVFETQKNADADVLKSPWVKTENTYVEEKIAPTTNASKSVDYVINISKSSGKFHYPDCQSVKIIKEENKKYFTGDRQTLIEQGYDPCGNCKP